MAGSTQGTGYFTVENIVAVLRAVPQTDGTHAGVVKRAREYVADIPKHTLGKCVPTGRRGCRAGDRRTAYAKFAAHFDRLKSEHCTADANRQRGYERALHILEPTCKGGEKMTTQDGGITRRWLCQTKRSRNRHDHDDPGGRENENWPHPEDPKGTTADSTITC